MPTRLYLTPEGEKTLHYWTENISKDFTNKVVKAWASTLAARIKGLMDAAFNNEAQPYGGAWMPLTAKYRESKQRRGYSTAIGTASGRLRRSLFSQVENRRGAVVEAGSSGVDYADFFNAKRPFIPPRTAAQADARAIFDDKMKRFIEGVERG